MRLGKVLTLALLAWPLSAFGAACPTGYSFSRAFTVAPRASTLTAFPVPMPFNGISTSSYTFSDLKGTASGGQIQTANGYDVVFCDAATSGNLLNFERVSYDSTSGQAEFYVGLTIPTTGSSTIWMFYGKTADTDHSSAASVWTAANYVFVQHYGTAASLSVTDSTGTTTPANHSATATSGEIGGALNVASASSQYVDAGASVNQTTVTVELWAKAASFNACQRILSNLTGSGYNGYEVIMGSACTANGSVQWQVGNAGNLMSYTYPSNVSTGAWNHFTVTQTGSTASTYFNGASVTSTITGAQTIGTSTVNLNIGRWPGSASNYFNGAVDEVRVASVVKSADWVQANYQAQTSPTSFAVMQAGACPTGYSFSKQFVISAQSAVMNGFVFPMPFNGIATNGYTLTDLKGTGSGGQVQTASGYDVVFCDNSGNMLSFERASYVSSSGAAEFYVGANLSNATTTTVNMYYGKAGDTDHSSPITTWSNAGYVFVQHYGSSSSLALSDSTGNTTPLNHGATATSGVINGAANVAAASSQYIDAGSPVNQSTLTVEMWANPTSFIGCQRMLSNVQNPTYNGYELYMGTPCAANGKAVWQVGNAGSLMSYTYPSAVTTGTWSHFAVSQTGTTASIYLNGAAQTPVIGGTQSIGISSANLNVGRFSGGATSYFDGSLEEIRVANVVKPAAWIAADYNSQNSPSTFAVLQIGPTTNQPIIGVISGLRTKSPDDLPRTSYKSRNRLYRFPRTEDNAAAPDISQASGG